MNNTRVLNVGISLKAQHYQQILNDRPTLSWLEVHSENYFGDGGMPLYYLQKIREYYPISLHGVGLSLGSSDPINMKHLMQLKKLMAMISPCFISEHACWSSINGQHTNELLPLPYTEQTLQHMIKRIQFTQDYLNQLILIENISSYIQYQQSTIAEWDFLNELAAQTGCGILLDINNIYVNSCNHHFEPETYLRSISADFVKEIHLAGFTRYTDETNSVLIDTHGEPVHAEVWELYKQALQCYGPVPTLIEWDNNIPALETLCKEAAKAKALLC